MFYVNCPASPRIPHGTISFLDILKGGPQIRDCKAHVCQDAVTRNGFMAKFLVLTYAFSQMPFEIVVSKLWLLCGEVRML